MTKAEAKRHACWIASRWLQSDLDVGAELSTGWGGGDNIDPNGKDAMRIHKALLDLVAELDRRGSEMGDPIIDGRRRAP